jgi:hypothetical protein
MVKDGIVLWRVTHVSQNMKLDQVRVFAFGTYEHQSTDSDLRYDLGSLLILMRQTYGSLSLEKCGARTIRMKTSSTADRLTVVLGVTLSREKLPPFISC